MIDCVSVLNMRNSDRQTIALGMSGVELIQRAAQAVYQCVEWHGKIAIVVGSGNNGADGLALSCILKENGYAVSVYQVSEKLHSDAAHYAVLARQSGVRICLYERGVLAEYDILVDCLLGTGFNGELRESYRQAIEEVNECNACVISVDINSGMNGDTGEAELAVRSNLTVTVQFVKNGMIQARAGEYIQRLVCVDIGIVLEREENKVCTDEEWEALSERHPITEYYAVIDGRTYYRRPKWLEL